MALDSDPLFAIDTSASVSVELDNARKNLLRHGARRIVEITADDAIDTWDTDPETDLSQASVFLCDATSGAITLDLPPIATDAGRVITVIKTDAGGNAVTLDGDGSETINGSTTKALAAQYDTVTIAAHSSEWIVVAEL